MMRTWSFYDPTTGLFTGQVFRGPDDESLEINARAGTIVVEGRHDHLSKRVDLVTGEVVDYQPPQPDTDHEWDATTNPEQPRWRKRRDVMAWEDEQRLTQQALADLDLRSIRRLRALSSDPQLSALEAEAEAHRTKIRKPKPV